MRKILITLSSFAIAAVVTLVQTARADDFDLRPAPGNHGIVVRCASNDHKYNYCYVGHGVVAYARLLRQISDSPCREGQSWGHDDSGIWVDRGCRGDFQVERGWAPPPPPHGGDLVRCASNDYAFTRCYVGGYIRSVQIAHQLSDRPCIYGQTWGYDNSSIWTDRGCRAEFRVYRY